MSKKLIIIGMGGHSKVVTDVAKRNDFEIIGYLDDRHPESSHSSYLGVVDEAVGWKAEGIQFFIGIGDNAARHRVAERLTPLEVSYAVLIDPTAIIGSGVKIMEGTLIMPGCILNTDSVIGRHVIINTAATVDHDCQISDFVHLSPGVHLAGNVAVGLMSHLGIGSSVIPGCKVGQYTIIGAGATVIDDLPAHCTAVGTPAKPIKYHSSHG